MQTNKS